jgi:hypothetical protein
MAPTVVQMGMPVSPAPGRYRGVWCAMKSPAGPAVAACQSDHILWCLAPRCLVAPQPRGATLHPLFHDKPRSTCLHRGRRPGAGRGTGDAHACRTRRWRRRAGSVRATCPHTPRLSLRSVVSRMVVHCGLCAAETTSVAGAPWPGHVSKTSGLGRSAGVRSPGLRLAAAVVRPGKATQGNLQALLRQGPASLRSVLRSLDTRALRLGFAA